MNTTDTPTPCDNNYEPFDALVDHLSGPVPVYAVDAVKKLCGGCPIWRDCYRENRKEPWVKAVVRQIKREERAAARALPAPITDELRALHATFVRLQTKGIKRADMPTEVVEGERLYQSRRYAMKKAA